MALALWDTLSEVINVLERGRKAKALQTTKHKVIHLVTGDGIQTNEAAMRIVLGKAALGDLGTDIDYRVVNWVCASHVSNIVVEVDWPQGHMALLTPAPLFGNSLWPRLRLHLRLCVFNLT